MVEKPGQGDENLRQDGSRHNNWIHLTIAFGILLAVALFVALGLLLQWYFTSNLSIAERKDLLQGLASVAQALAVFLTGAVGLIGLYFTWRNLRQSREYTENQLELARESQERTQESTQQTLRLTEQGQRTERFTRAIDQLGSDKLEIRLGGIYALERIAWDSRSYHSGQSWKC